MTRQTASLLAPHLIFVAMCLLCLDPARADIETAWLKAIQARDVKEIGLLLGKGPVDVNLATEDGTSALMVAAKKSDVPLIQRLMKNGARINAPNGRGGTAIMYAAIGGNPETLRTLLVNGAEPDAVSENGWSALMIACVKGHEGIAKTLLDLGVDPDRPDVYGWTPLMRAVDARRDGVVRLLLRDGIASINARNESGATALHYATANNDLDLVKLLLSAGADPGIEENSGITSIRLARKRGYKQIADVLEQTQ